MRRLLLVAAVLSCGKSDPNKADTKSSAFATVDDEVAALDAFMTEVGAAVTAGGADCTKLDAAFAPLRAKADALAARLGTFEVPPARAHDLGTKLEGPIDAWVPKIKDCMAKANVMGLFQGAGWVAIRHTVMQWVNAVAVPTDAAPTTDTHVDAARCTAAIAHATDAKQDAFKQMMNFDDAHLDAYKALVADHCAKDGWSPEVVTCFEHGTSETDVFRCMAMLPTALGDKVTADIKARHDADVAKSRATWGFTIKADHDPSVVTKKLDTGFGKQTPTTVYVGFQGYPVAGTPGVLEVLVYDLPAKWKKAKPKAVFAQLKTDLGKLKVKVEKDADVKLGKDVGRDVHYVGTDVRADLGKSVTHEHWFLRAGKLYQVRSSYADKGAGAVDFAKQGDAFIDSFAFAK